MAIELATWEQSVGYVEWNCGENNVISYTRLYVKYAMESSTTARVYVRQVVATRDSGWTWGGTNNYYRTRCDGKYDSGYNKYASGWNHTETEVWHGSFTCTTAGWKSLQCYFATIGGSHYGETWTDVYVPESAFSSSPSGLSVSIVEKYKDGAKFNVRVNDWGRGATSDRYFEAAFMNHGYPYGGPYTYKHGTHGINAGVTEAITVTNNSKEPQSSITIVPNTQYYYGAWASNQSGAESINTIPGTLVTLPDELNSKSAETVDAHTIKINYATKADGGKYAKKIQYSLNNSTWTIGATVSTGSATSGSFNITGLKAGTQYTVYLRISTDAGITTSGSVTANTKTVCKIIRGNSVIEAIPYVIKPDGTKIELNVRRV